MRTQTVSQVPRPSEATKEQAERLWELAIRAKGGRERLYSVRNMVVSFGGSKRPNVGLDVFPDKYWSFDDWGDGYHRSVHMYNGDPKSFWFQDQSMTSAKMAEVSDETPRFTLLKDQLIFLMETAWVRPVPIEARTEQIGKQTVDVVRTTIGKYLVDYYLDQQTHLPVEVKIFDPTLELENKELVAWRYLHDYADVGGVQLPRKLGETELTYHIDVDYDLAIFERPPSIEAGPHAWRRPHADTPSPRP